MGGGLFSAGDKKADQKEEHEKDAEVGSGFFRGEIHVLESGLHADEDEWKDEG